MAKVHLVTRTRVSLFLMDFQNVNVYAKGRYRLKIEAFEKEERCSISGSSNSGRSSEMGKKDTEQYFTKEFKVRYQNEKVTLNEFITIETPSFKYSRNNKVLIKLTFLKAESNKGDATKTEGPITQYTPLRVSYGILRFTLNTFCEYVECTFQEPFLSTISALMFVQPMQIGIDFKEYRNGDGEALLQLRKEVKKFRYNSYLVCNKFKKVFYSVFAIDFTLPGLFLDGQGTGMEEVATDEQNLLSYLVNYEGMNLSPVQMQVELTSICKKHDQFQAIFKNNCQKDTVCTAKLKAEFEEKESKKNRMHVAKELYRQHFYQEYKGVLKDKLKILGKERELGCQDELLYNVVFKMDNVFEQGKPLDIPECPVVLHETERMKPIVSKSEGSRDSADSVATQEPPNSQQIRYILVLGHGYQGCPDDLTLFANGFKKQYRKTKYLVLKSYRNKMGGSIQSMAEGAAEEVDTFIDSLDFRGKTYRIVMVGHSMGGLILRVASNNIKHKELLFAFLSLGTPHLGYLQGLKLHIRAGLSLFSNIYSNPCLDELSGKDAEQLHNSSIYKMSKTGHLNNFKKVIFISCSKDKYVSWHSARVQNFNKDLLNKRTFFQKEMVGNILGKEGRIERVDRMQVSFKLNESSMDKIIGRTCHIKLLTDLSFIDLVCSHCLPPIFQE